MYPRPDEEPPNEPHGEERARGELRHPGEEPKQGEARRTGHPAQPGTPGQPPTYGGPPPWSPEYPGGGPEARPGQPERPRFERSERPEEQWPPSGLSGAASGRSEPSEQQPGARHGDPGEERTPHEPASPGEPDPGGRPGQGAQPDNAGWAQPGQTGQPDQPGWAQPNQPGQPGQQPGGQWQPEQGPPPPGQYGPPGEPYGQQWGPTGSPPYDQPYPQATRGQPGGVIGARALMFIGAGIGLLFALLFGLVAAIPEATQGLDQGAAIDGVQVRELPMVFGAVAFVVGTYGLVSLVLASLMGKRSLAVFWTALVFQVLMLLLPLSSLTYGAVQAVVPLLFTVAIIVLLLLPTSRAYYQRR